MIDMLQQQVTRIPLYLRRLAQQTRLGQHQSHQRGSGLEFDQLREYQAGETTRHINWAATARRGVEIPLVNAYYEEKEITIMLLVDLSASMDFGSVRLTKRSLAAEICTSLVYAALATHDHIGLLGFSSGVACYVPPRPSRTYLQVIPETILQCQTAQEPASFHTAVATLVRRVQRPALVFVVSDFLTDDTQQLHHALAQLGRRHDPVALVLGDPLEVTLPTGTARLVLHDLETNHVRSYSLTRSNQQRMVADQQARRAHLQHLFQDVGIAHLTVTPHSHYHQELCQLFLTRHRRRAST